MRLFIATILAAMPLLWPAEAGAMLGKDHWKAWDRYERSQGTRSTVKHGKKIKRVAGRSVPRKSIKARLSPAIARTPVAAVANFAAQILPHPPGCPRRLFCGCGAAIEVFGRPVRHLWLAANWLKFPPAAPAPGMVAARPGHVMVIRQYLGNNRALVYDANSGGGLTRVHVRSLSGFSIRNPRA